MHEIAANLALGFDVAFSWENLFYCLLGATIGTAIGVLPGISPITAIAVLLPVTFKIPAVASLIMLCGIYYGSHHAGSTTAIMLNMPGEPTSVVICIDGHPMARKGRAGVALCMSAIAATFSAAVGVIIVAALSPTLAGWALEFKSPEYASMVVLSLVVAAALQGSSLAITIGMALLGVLLGTVGTDANTGLVRFTFGLQDMSDGIDLIAVAIGLFAIAEMVTQVGAPERARVAIPTLRGLIPRLPDFQASWKPILRGTALGSLIGIFPSTGPLLSSFVAYAVERKLARDPSRFGQGAIEGVAGPEAANNAATVTHFIPMLTLGIPAGPAMALMLSAMLIQGITPGPEVITKHPDLFWGIIASMWIGNWMLLVLNLPLVGVWVRLLMTPYRLMYPAILTFCCIGAYTEANTSFDVFVAAVAGLAGYGFKLLGCSPAPLILGLVFGPLLEQNFRRAMQLSRGDPLIFIERPVSLAILVIALAMVIVITHSALGRGKRAPG